MPLPAFGLYSFVSAVMGGPAALLSLVSLEVVPPFDKPWLVRGCNVGWGVVMRLCIEKCDW